MSDQPATTREPETIACLVAPPVVERRRAGRVEYLNGYLIALLRRPAGDAPPPLPAAREMPDISDEWDRFAPARGIIFGLIAVIPFWAGVAALVWWWFNG